MSDTQDVSAVAEAAQPTILSSVLRDRFGVDPAPYLGTLTPATFSDVSEELSALTGAAGIFDRGHRVRVRVTGEDRVRWLNGMVTNTVKALAPGEHNYTFILNAQGRIQGDAEVFAEPEALLIETDRSQLDHLLAHLERFIIMDDVELAGVPGSTTVGLAGPGAEAILRVPLPEPGRFTRASLGDMDTTLVNSTLEPAYPRFDLWVEDVEAGLLWSFLLERGAVPCGSAAVEALRVLEGIPLYGVDIQEKTLAQETGQSRALNFSKGCYLGQEIVERIRSRANVHRSIRRLRLEGAVAPAGAPLTADGTPAGELTSIAQIALPGLEATLALGTVRNELLERAGALDYPGGVARPLPAQTPA